MMLIEEVTDKKLWEGFLSEKELAWTSFFQSWDFGEVQKRLGQDVYRLGIINPIGRDLVGLCSVVFINAKRGRFVHLRHGPVLLKFSSQFDTILDGVKQKAKNLGADFIRMSPLLEEGTFDRTFLVERGFRNAPVHNMDAENAWILDITKSEEEILSGMRKTTRYLIRKAKKMPITIRMSTAKEDFNSFMKLYELTSKRHKFVPHKGISEEFDVFSKNGQAKLFLAEYESKIIAGALIVFYGNQAVYHHAATDDTYKEIPAAYLMQWEIIKEAKKQGKLLYNFWGVVPENRPNHPWQGLTMFKTGFGGKRVNFVHAQDLPLTPMYWKSFAIETLWRIRKGY